MLSRLFFRRIVIFGLLAGVALLLQAWPTSAANDQNGTGEGVDVLTRGPIHEAFADVSVDETQPSTVISRSVPEPINEIPPDFRPEGAHVEWIAGYWSWDEDKNDFIWVSGVWRDVPPGRQWVPGNWISAEGGNQYISGFWTGIEQTEMVYLPPPPQPPAAPPSSPALTPNHIWMEGNWVWYNGRYAWQTGYWLEQRPDMVWIPAHYLWTPRGYVFVMGYWDYQLARRGVIFAPLYYAHPIYRNHGYYYTPRIILDIDTVFLSLFIRRDSRHYYFGDYYDARYEKRGFRPWYSKHATRHGYDPYYRSYRLHQLRHDREWENNNRRQFEYRREHKEARPPRIYSRQTSRNVDRSHGTAHPVIGRRLTDVVEKKDQPVRFTHLPPVHKQQFQTQDRKVKKLGVEHRKLEMIPSKEGKSWKPAEIKGPAKVKMPSSPIKTRSEKAPVFSKPQEKPQNSRHVRSEEQTKNRHRLQPQEKQELRQQYKPEQNKPEQRPQTKSQGKQQMKLQNRPDEHKS